MRQPVGYLLVGALALLVLGVVGDVRSTGSLQPGLRKFPGDAGGPFASLAIVVAIAAGVLLGWSHV